MMRRELDERDRCCGRKPIQYRLGPPGPRYFCPRCDRAYSLFTKEQIENWAWMEVEGDWVRRPITPPSALSPGHDAT